VNEVEDEPEIKLPQGDDKIIDKCPGASDIRAPTIKVKTCHKCGNEVELFSDEIPKSA